MPLAQDIALGRAEQPCQPVSKLSEEPMRQMIVAHHALTMTIAPAERIMAWARLKGDHKPFGIK
jgi:hypothetical protein